MNKREQPDVACDASNEPLECKLIAAASDGMVNITPEKCERIRRILAAKDAPTLREPLEQVIAEHADYINEQFMWAEKNSGPTLVEIARYAIRAALTAPVPPATLIEAAVRPQPDDWNDEAPVKDARPMCKHEMKCASCGQDMSHGFEGHYSVFCHKPGCVPSVKGEPLWCPQCGTLVAIAPVEDAPGLRERTTLHESASARLDEAKWWFERRNACASEKFERIEEVRRAALAAPPESGTGLREPAEIAAFAIEDVDRVTWTKAMPIDDAIDLMRAALRAPSPESKPRAQKERKP